MLKLTETQTETLHDAQRMIERVARLLKAIEVDPIDQLDLNTERLSEAIGCLQSDAVRDLLKLVTPIAPTPDFTDFDVRQDGSVFMFTVLTDSALAHVQERVPLESWQWLGSHTFAVDHRLAPDLAYQLREDGFSVRVH